MKDRLHLLLASSLAVFVVGIDIAMATYPGGTWNDPMHQGHDFLQNFFCDLTHDVALNGGGNRWGSRIATVAMVALVPGMVAFWLLAARLLPSGFGQTMVRVSGIFSAVGVAVVAVLPSNHLGPLHGFAVIMGTVPGLFASLTATAGLLRAGHKAAAALGGLTLLTSAIDAALYVQHVSAHANSTHPLLAPVQKLAAGFLLAWMASVALAASKPKKAAATKLPPPAPVEEDPSAV